MSLKEKNYNEIYGKKGYSKKSGLLAWLYSNLKRYEVDRCSVAFKMLVKGEKLLDIGCGSGDFCIKAKELFDSPFGIDISGVRITAAQSKVEGRSDKDSFCFLKEDIDKNLPFPNDYFDVVTCLATLEYVLYPRPLMKEMTRVLKPGGFLVLQVANFAFFPNRFALLFGKLPTAGGIDDIGVDWERLHSFNKRTLVKLFEINALEIIDLTCSGIFSRSRKIYPSLLAGDIIVKARKPKI